MRRKSKYLQELVCNIGGVQLGRSLHQHINSEELNALVPSRLEAGRDSEAEQQPCLTEIQRHVAMCTECRSRVRKYALLMSRSSSAGSHPMGPSADCPRNIDWNEVAVGGLPESAATHLISHASTCAHCGPLLRLATRARCNRGSVERIRHRLQWWTAIKWSAPAAALIGFVALLLPMLHAPVPRSMTGVEFAELAVTTHRRYIQGELALDLRSDSQQTVNQWLNAKSSFHLSLPSSPTGPGDDGTYRPAGARLIQVGRNNAAFVAYDMMANPQRGKPTARPIAASLMVVPGSLALAAGGVELRFTKVSFHYATVHGYKVVTWSAHGLTYALVSGEGNDTQRSCMVCHSAMRDRDLTSTPTPLSER